ncbi:hypothetical protein [Latilactobacillus sakei]|uniref:hypothetical protein n=1 Tax=Latilactobacillus sakei TaxID=1599 RepID=UPI000B9D69C4|nr:hypothetical protein [Latilactobacillus sakei]BAX68623.1 hypothetical protein LASAK_01215 [Latilactobacillus sakei]
MRLYLKNTNNYINSHISELFSSGVLSLLVLYWEIGWHTQLRKLMDLGYATSSQDALGIKMLFVLLPIVYILFLVWLVKVLRRLHGSNYFSGVVLIMIPLVNFALIVQKWEKWYGINILLVFTTFILMYVLVANVKNYSFMLWTWIKPGSEFDYKRMNIVIGIGGILIGLLVGKF